MYKNFLSHATGIDFIRGKSRIKYAVSRSFPLFFHISLCLYFIMSFMRYATLFSYISIFNNANNNYDTLTSSSVSRLHQFYFIICYHTNVNKHPLMFCASTASEKYDVQKLSFFFCSSYCSLSFLSNGKLSL